MFPFDVDEEEFELDIKESEIPCDWEIDLATGKLTGRKISGLEAIKQWIYIALNTARYRYEQYSWNFGSEIEDLIGKGYTLDLIESEVKRMITDCLLIHEDIESINDLICTMEKDLLKIQFHVNTNYGGIDISV